METKLYIMTTTEQKKIDNQIDTGTKYFADGGRGREFRAYSISA